MNANGVASPLRWHVVQLLKTIGAMCSEKFGFACSAAPTIKPPKTIPDSIGHHAEWIKACKEGGKTTCDFSYSGPLAECALLGIVSHRVGNKKLDWDWQAMKAVNCPEAAQFVHHKYQKGWSL